MTFRIASALLASSLLCACDGQVDSSYRGEPLMTLSGAVVASEMPLEGEPVPLLYFPHAFPTEPFETITWWNFYVRGDVSGSFPNAFTMKVYDPPDPRTLALLRR